MNARVRERVEEWNSRPFSGGHAGLSDLADEEFSGIVEADSGPSACLLNGTAVGVFDGRMSDLSDAEGTAYVAPDPALPLLFAMWETGGTLEDQYYTEDTPISQADETLSSGGFVGYLELGENVLSGDYYVCYYGDRSMSVAFVGSSERLVTGDEAFDRADDEVGIYDVYSVDLDVVEIPGSESDDGVESTTTGIGTGTEREPETETEAGRELRSESVGATADDGDRDDRTGTDPFGGPDEASDVESNPAWDRLSGWAGSVTDRDEGSQQDDRSQQDVGDDRRGRDRGRRDRQSDDRQRGVTGHRENEPRADTTPGSTGSTTGRAGDAGERARDDTSRPSGPGVPGGESRTADIDRLNEQIRRYESEIDGVRDRVSTLEANANDRDRTVDRLESRLDEVENDVGDLRRIVMRLDQAVERLDAELAGSAESAAPERQPGTESTDAAVDGSTPDEEEPGTARAGLPLEDQEPDRETSPPTEPAEDGSLPVDRALRETTVLVQYGSQGRPTLTTAHEGAGDRPAVVDNLGLTVHTAFDERSVTVEGHSARKFLTDRLEYGFLDWLLRDLLFEIRDTGNDEALTDVYDAIPLIDRAEFQGEVKLEDEVSGTETVEFDLIARDDRENPLVVMNFHDGREPAEKGMVVELQKQAKRVRETAGLGAAFLVTTSYFDGKAKDVAEEATSGSILSRSSKRSYVRVSRKQGFHLCLVTVSDGEFHLKMPELSV